MKNLLQPCDEKSDVEYEVSRKSCKDAAQFQFTRYFHYLGVKIYLLGCRQTVAFLIPIQSACFSPSQYLITNQYCIYEVFLNGSCSTFAWFYHDTVLAEYH